MPLRRMGEAKTQRKKDALIGLARVRCGLRLIVAYTGIVPAPPITAASVAGSLQEPITVVVISVVVRTIGPDPDAVAEYPMTMAVIEISTMVEISFCEVLMRMIFASYEPIMIAAVEVISVRAFREVLSPHSTVMCHCTGVHVTATAHSTIVRHGVHIAATAHAPGMSHRTHASGVSHRARRPWGHPPPPPWPPPPLPTSSTSPATTATAAAVPNERNAAMWAIENGNARRVGCALQ